MFFINTCNGMKYIKLNGFASGLNIYNLVIFDIVETQTMSSLSFLNGDSMSLIDLINDDNVWNDFLEHKQNSSHLPEKVIKRYEEFIINKEYRSIATAIQNENYIFSTPKKTLIGKTGKSKKRAVYLFKKGEIYILKLISYLMYKYDNQFSPNLFSFRQNSGVRKAIRLLTKKRKINDMYGYKVDISNYFNSIPVDILLKDLQIFLNDDKLYNLFEQILINKQVSFEDNIIEEEKGIMAGVPISSFLANFYLREMDTYFYRNKIKYIRYADDIIVFGNTLETVKNYSNTIKDFLRNKGLKVNHDKEYYYNPGDEIEFLGFSYKNGIIDISSNSFKKMKGKIKRSARSFRRWMLKKDASYEITLKAMNRKFNRKFYGKNENDLTWKFWFFPIINTDKTLKKIDAYMQQEQRYVVTGVHNKKNFEKVPYEFLKQSNYRSLVNEYYKDQT